MVRRLSQVRQSPSDHKRNQPPPSSLFSDQQVTVTYLCACWRLHPHRPAALCSPKGMTGIHETWYLGLSAAVTEQRSPGGLSSRRDLSPLGGLRSERSGAGRVRFRWGFFLPCRRPPRCVLTWQGERTLVSLPLLKRPQPCQIRAHP